MKVLITILLALSFNTAQAFDFPNTGDIPNDNQWSKAMTSRACNVKFQKSDVGTIDDAKKGVVYTVYNKDGVVLASAWASSTFVLAKKKCLMK